MEAEKKQLDVDLAKHLNEVIKAEYTQEECIGYIAGFKDAYSLKQKEIEQLKTDYNNEVLNSESLQRYWGYSKEENTKLKEQLKECKKRIDFLENSTQPMGFNADEN